MQGAIEQSKSAFETAEKPRAREAVTRTARSETRVMFFMRGCVADNNTASFEKLQTRKKPRQHE